MLFLPSIALFIDNINFMSFMRLANQKILFTAIICLWLLMQTVAISTASAQPVSNGSQHTLILNDKTKEHYLSPYLIKYEDEDGNITAKDIISGLFLNGEMYSGSGSIVTLGLDGHTNWLSFDVMNRSKEEKWKIDFGNSLMGRYGFFDSIEAYSYNLSTNKLQKFEVQANGSTLFNFERNKKTKIILKLDFKKGLPTAVPLQLVRYDKHLSTDGSLHVHIMSILLIGMGFFFTAIGFMRSQYYYFYFTLYYVLLSLLFLMQNSFAISPISLLGSAVIPFYFLLISISGFLLSRIFWEMDTKSKLINGAFIGVIGLSILSYLLGLFLPIDIAAAKYALYYGPSLFLIILIPLISVLQMQRGEGELSTFIFGWLILILGTIISIMALGNMLPTVSTAINSVWFSIIPQMFFFVMASKIKFENDYEDVKLSQKLEIDETENVTRLRKTKENTEQDRLLKVIEQERKVLGELRKSEARRTEEMRIAKDDADQANKAKSAFLAVVSHEIRTPMTGIMGMIRLLLDSNLTKEQKEYAQTVQDSSDAMLALLNDILDFEKIEQGKMVLENISFDLHRLINGVSTLMKGHAAQKNIRLNTKIGDNLTKYVYGDPTRLRQVLLNLAGNAIKFTNEGGVTITAELMRDKKDGTCEIYFGVSDSGVGIPKESQKNLFSPFSQADTSISRKFGGTGLGLAISKGLVEGMGSTININSKEGEGSTFFFTLNMPVADNDSSGNKFIAQKRPEKSKSLKIMVVDDNKINQKVVEGFLNKTQHKVTMIDSAQIAINRLEKENFDLILMDIEMPALKGDEATKLIRQSDDAKIKDIPIIALTGNTMPKDIKHYYECGMNGIISKPIDIDILKSKINKAGEGIFDNLLDTAIIQNVQNAKDQEKETNKKKPTFEGSEVSVKQKPAEEIKDSEEENLENTLKSETLDTLKTHLKIKDIQEMLDDVTKKNDEIITSINVAVKDNKMNDLAARAHEMKGMAGNFGLMELSEQAAKIEVKAKGDEAIIVLTALVEPLPEMQKRAKKALDAWIEKNKD